MLLKRGRVRQRVWVGHSDSVKRHLPIEYAADLTPVVVAKEARASWNARGMAETVDFSSRKKYRGMASGRTPGKIARHVEGQAPRRSTGIRRKSDEPVGSSSESPGLARRERRRELAG